MQRLALVPFVLAALPLAACAQRLTPEGVRTQLDTPTGTVSNATMARVTRDLFMADRATAVQSFADLLKSDQSAGDTSRTALPGVSTGVLEDTGDVFCVGGLVASIATFDACELGSSCRGELVLDSCLLRVGEEAADEDARGKIKFALENTVEASFDRSTLDLEFDGWESSRDDALLDTFAGVIALETTQAHDDSAIELVFASDLDVGVRTKVRPLFDDGVVERTNVSAGLRFQAAEGDEEGEASGSLEVLAFVDEDGGNDESVVVRLAADSHRVDATTVTADATLEVVGENGTFACTWSAAEVEGLRDAVHVESAGECVDADGQTFSFSGTLDS